MSTTPLLEQLDEAAESVSRRSPLAPVVGLVLGSGLGAFADRLAEAVRIPYREIPYFPEPSGVVGHAGELVLGRVGKAPVAVLSGRIHFYEGGPMTDVVFPVRLLARLGIRAAILTNAAGGVRRSFKPGDLMLLTDHINGFGTNPLIGPNDERLGLRFPDMSFVYDPALRRIILSAARKLKIPLKQGVYIGLHGPSYETPAEVRACRTLGADAVGMSTVPEAVALRHIGVRVAGISTITNMAAGILARPLVHTEVLETTQRVGARFIRLLTAAVPRIAAEVSK
jgi:purine-nucleoside phosphorylase